MMLVTYFLMLLLHLFVLFSLIQLSNIITIDTDSLILHINCIFLPHLFVYFVTDYIILQFLLPSSIFIPIDNIIEA